MMMMKKKKKKKQEKETKRAEWWTNHLLAFLVHPIRGPHRLSTASIAFTVLFRRVVVALTRWEEMLLGVRGGGGSRRRRDHPYQYQQAPASLSASVPALALH